MKTIGIIGGMSWESTVKYYQKLNEGVRNILGGLHSAKILMSSVEFSEIEELQSSGEWEKAGNLLAGEARKLELAGADFILLATNTMHKVAPQIETGLTIPFIHLADATAEKIKSQGLNEVGLLATVYTMEEDFYTGRLTDKNIKVIVPEKPVRESVNRVIFNELCLGKKEKSSKELFIQAAKEMFDKGAQGLILGCTEISMLIDQQDFKEPVFDTTKIHIEKALGLALD